MSDHEDKNRTKSFLLFSFLFIILNFLDAELTLFAIQNGATEFNPLIAKNMNNIFLFKTIGVSLIIFCAYNFMKKVHNQIAIVFPNLVMMCVVAWNTTQIYLNVII